MKSTYLGHHHGNLFWAEFLQTQQGRLDFLDQSLQADLEKVASHKIAEEYSYIAERFKDLLSRTKTAQKQLRGMRKWPRYIKGLNKLRTRRTFRQATSHIPAGYADLLILITQNSIWKPSKYLDLKGLSLFRIPEESKLAWSSLLNECSAVMDNSKRTPTTYPRPKLVCWPQLEYIFLGHSHLIGVPPCDVYRCYLWPSITHEAFHAKEREITVGPEKARKWQELRQTLGGRLKDKTIDFHFNYAAKLADGDIFIPPVAYYWQQVSEIACDIGTLKLLGLSNVLATAATWALSCRNPLFAMDSYLTSPTHPPSIIRLWYMFDVLKKEMGYSKNEDFIYLENEFKQLCRLDAEEDSNPIVTIYKDILRSYVPKISKFICSTMHQEDFFTNEIWQNLTEAYRKSRDIPRIVDSMLSSQRARSLINLAWVKRIRMWKECDNLAEYRQNLKKTSTFFKELVRCMASLEHKN